MGTVDTAETARRVKETLARVLAIPIDKISDNSLLVEEFGLDSFGTVELLYELEDVTGIEVRDDETPAAKTVRDLVDYVTLKLEERG